MKKYKAKKIRRMQGNQPGNAVGLHMFGGGGSGVVSRRVKYIFKDTKEEVTLEKLNDQISRKED